MIWLGEIARLLIVRQRSRYFKTMQIPVRVPKHSPMEAPWHTLLKLPLRSALAAQTRVYMMHAAASNTLLISAQKLAEILPSHSLQVTW